MAMWWQSFSNDAGLYADMATIMMAVVAFLAAVSTLLIYVCQRIADRRSFAMGLVRDYSTLALENPCYANPELAELDYDVKTFNGSQKEFEKYGRFVDFVLWTDEELLRVLKDDRWRASVRLNLEDHVEYLKLCERSVYGNYDDFFSKQLVGMIREVIDDTEVKKAFLEAEQLLME